MLTSPWPGVMVAMANKSSRDTARRVARAKQRMAEAGQSFGGGLRPYGYEDDHMTTREDEAAEIRRAADGILAGVSLGQIAASLRDRGIPTATGGARWEAVTVRDILLRPRNAGLMVYRPDGTGKAGPPTVTRISAGAPWPAILPEHQWRAVAAILTDPSRRNGPGPTPKHLGSGIFRCGRCDDGTTLVVCRSETGPTRHARYTCSPHRQRNDLPFAQRKWHLSRSVRIVDEFVTEAVIARLERPDAADLLPSQADGADVASLRTEAASIRELLNDLGRSFARGRIDLLQLEAGSAELRARLTEIESILASLTDTSPLAGVAGRADAREIWDGLDLGRRRAVLRALVDVALMPARKLGGRFDPDAIALVDPVWR
jgi:site-specific DNA recombinase